MIFEITKLVLDFKKSKEIIPFNSITYFYGQMGAGKSSIARLVDYCLGGDLDYSPALQQEFNSATLVLNINNNVTTIHRVCNSNQLVVNGVLDEDKIELVVPVDAGGELIPDSGIENLSDLVYRLIGITPPKVRRSKVREDSDLQRLSIRNLLWYCYLDQDDIDSDFFHLGDDANNWKKLQSRDVLRHVVGFHQEKVAELEAEAQSLREEKQTLESSSRVLRDVLNESGIGSESDIQIEINTTKRTLDKLDDSIEKSKNNIKKELENHAVDELKIKASRLQAEIDSIRDAIVEIEKIKNGDEIHVNELVSLKVKMKRDSYAREILSGVNFQNCPACTKPISNIEKDICPLCKQEGCEDIENDAAINMFEQDANSRIAELKSAINRHGAQLLVMKSRLLNFRENKSYIDNQISKLSQEYDSAFLSSILSLERESAKNEQYIAYLNKILKLPSKAEKQQKIASELSGSIKSINLELKELRKEAEKDTGNLKLLENLFLDCLIRSKVPGIKSNDYVSIKSPKFLPEVFDSNVGDLAVTSFSNISSGGKKTLFKCCFALAFHRLARTLGEGILPPLLIIDSPMKNISERENKEQFESFMQLVYELSTTELKGVQIVIIDKEYLAPEEESNIDIYARHMKPNSEEFPPLIPYYQGH